jgi:hypothetical protein
MVDRDRRPRQTLAGTGLLGLPFGFIDQEKQQTQIDGDGADRRKDPECKWQRMESSDAKLLWRREGRVAGASCRSTCRFGPRWQALAKFAKKFGQWYIYFDLDST